MDWTAMLAGGVIAYAAYDGPRLYCMWQARRDCDAPVVTPAE